MTLDQDLQTRRRRGRTRALAVAAALLLGLPAAGYGWHRWINLDRGPAGPGIPAAAGSREDVADALYHVRLRGSGYALGHQHGTLLRGEVRELVRFLREDLLGKGLLGAASRDWMLRKAWRLHGHVPDRFREEMRGLADGAGVDYADILLVNTFDDLRYVSGCSSAVLLPERGEPLRHARNLDYPIPRLARHKVVFDLDLGSVRLRTVGFPGFVGVLTGMSDRGLGLSSHTSISHRNAVGIPSALLYRRMLEEARTLEEMRGLLVRSPRTIGNNLALSDAGAGTALALEFDAREVRTRPAVGGRLFVTNHFQIAALQPHQDAGWWTPDSGSNTRISCLARSLPGGGSTDLATLQAALGERGPGKAWRTPANPGTVQSVIMEPRSGRTWIAKGLELPVTAGGYVEIASAWPASSPSSSARNSATAR